MESTVNTGNNTVQRKAMMVDDDKDRYRRKERNESLKQAGYKVFPVLRMQDVCARCKPGAFDLIVVNGTQNPMGALELCDQIKVNDPDQKLFMVADASQVNASREYIVSNWNELNQRLAGQQENKQDLVAA